MNLAEPVRLSDSCPQATRAKASLASLAMFRGRFAEAESLFLEVLAFYEAAKMVHDTAITLGNLGIVSLRLRRVPQAVERLERSVAMLESHGQTGPVLMKSLGNLSVAYAEAGRHAEAAESANRAARLSEAWLGKESPATASILFECSLAMKVAGYKPEAKRLHNRAAGILRALNVPNRGAMIVDVSDLLPRSKPGR